GRRTVEGEIAVSLLPPGDYVARAVVNVDGRKAATVSRPFHVSSSGAAVSREAAPGAIPRPTIPFASRIDSFDRSAVLTPQVVGFFLDRAKTAAPAATIAEAKAGRFDTAAEATLQTAGSNNLAAMFLKGLALYSQGQLEGAAGQFRESLRLDSEFFP